MIKFGEVLTGDVIKYQFGFPPFEDEEPVVGVAISEVVEVTPKHCILEYMDFSGKSVTVPYSAIIEVYRKVK